VELPFKDGDLVAECQDLDVLVAVAHRQESEHREGVGHSKVCQAQQYGLHHRPVVASDPIGRCWVDDGKIPI
jgi:hypothetical protein